MAKTVRQWPRPPGATDDDMRLINGIPAYCYDKDVIPNPSVRDHYSEEFLRELDKLGRPKPDAD